MAPNEYHYCVHLHLYESQKAREARTCLCGMLLSVVPHIGEIVIVAHGASSQISYIVKEVYHIESDNSIELHCIEYTPWRFEMEATVVLATELDYVKAVCTDLAEERDYAVNTVLATCTKLSEERDFALATCTELAEQLGWCEVAGENPNT